MEFPAKLVLKVEGKGKKPKKTLLARAIDDKGAQVAEIEVATVNKKK
ncbi:MAG: hypothetical protein ACYTEQ_03420 [Planctomycetota bacterium]|jgi:hypothetical protein